YQKPPVAVAVHKLVEAHQKTRVGKDQSDSSRSRKSSPTTSVLGSSSVTGTPNRLFQSSLRERLLLEGSTSRAMIRPRLVIAICWPSNNIASIFGKEVRSSLTVTVLMLM